MRGASARSVRRVVGSGIVVRGSGRSGVRLFLTAKRSCRFTVPS